MLVLEMEEKQNCFHALTICGVDVGLIDEGLVNRYDIETHAHILDLEGHIKRILRENFGLPIKSAEDVEAITDKLSIKRNQTIAEWFNEYMSICIKHEKNRK